MALPWLNKSEQILFTQHLPEQISGLLQQAAYFSSFGEKRAEEQLWQAQQLFPQQLELYIVIYKFYLYHARLAEAHQTLHQALRVAAEAGGFPADWRILHAHTTNWRSPDIPHRVYLYSLHALVSLLQRMGSVSKSYQVIEKLYEIDAGDQNGSRVMQVLSKDEK